ncbi:hypothetical protein D3C87_1771460 [compost metagenome]
MKRALLRSQDFQVEASSLAAVKLAMAPRQPEKRVSSSWALVKSVPLKLQRSNRRPFRFRPDRSTSSKTHPLRVLILPPARASRSERDRVWPSIRGCIRGA